MLTAVELGAAFGRDEVVHAALGPGPLGARLMADAEKIAGFRAGAVVERASRPDPGEPALQNPGAQNAGAQNDCIGAR